MTDRANEAAGLRAPSLYERLLRLRHLRFRPWQRETLTWGMLVLATLLAMTGLVSPWVVLLLPLLVAGTVKLHDLATPRLDAAAQGLVPAAQTVPPAATPPTTTPPATTSAATTEPPVS